jgi:hypothetical protein
VLLGATSLGGAPMMFSRSPGMRIAVPFLLLAGFSTTCPITSAVAC